MNAQMVQAMDNETLRQTHVENEMTRRRLHIAVNPQGAHLHPGLLNIVTHRTNMTGNELVNRNMNPDQVVADHLAQNNPVAGGRRHRRRRSRNNRRRSRSNRRRRRRSSGGRRSRSNRRRSRNNRRRSRSNRRRRK